MKSYRLEARVHPARTQRSSDSIESRPENRVPGLFQELSQTIEFIR